MGITIFNKTNKAVIILYNMKYYYKFIWNLIFNFYYYMEYVNIIINIHFLLLYGICQYYYYFHFLLLYGICQYYY